MKGKSRILVWDDWFEEFEPGTYVEDTLERTIMSRGNTVFPEYFMLPFNKSIEYNGTSKKPDLCLIKKDYSEWFIIEIELAKKKFEGHTEDQINTFCYGNYNSNEIAKYLLTKDKKLDFKRLKKLIIDEEPGVLVMVDEYPDWSKKLKRYPRTGLLIFGMYDHPDGVEIYRIDGDFPLVETGRSRCVFPKFPANILTIISPKIIDIINGESMVVYFEGRKSIWERLDEGNKVFLIPKGRNPLNVKKKYFLIKNDKREFFIREN